MSKKIQIDPDWLIEWLRDCGYVESTSSAFRPYRIATNPDTDRPYTIKEMAKALGRSLNKGHSGHPKPMCRELKKCFEEFNITYLSLTDHARLFSEMKQSKLKEIEEKTGVNLDPLSKNERRKISIVYSNYIKDLGREEALKRIYLYAQRRLQNPGKDLRNGKARRFDSPADVEITESSSQSHTESMESILATSGALFSNRQIMRINPEAQEFYETASL